MKKPDCTCVDEVLHEALTPYRAMLNIEPTFYADVTMENPEDIYQSLWNTTVALSANFCPNCGKPYKGE